MRRIATILCAGLALAVTLAVPADVVAKNYPERPIRLVVAYAPGAATNNIARIIAGGLAERLGQPVVVENRPGGSGQIGSQHVASAAPDGYTLLIATQATHAVAPYMHANLGFDPIADFTPITLAVYSPLVLVTNLDVPVSNLQELIAYVRKNRGKVSYATGGVGTNSHMAALLLNSVTGLDAAAIPHQGEGPAIPQIVGGHLPYMFSSVPSAAPFITSRQVRALGVTGAARAPMLPDVPTIAEAGLKDFEVATWWAILGPARLPNDIVTKLNAELVNVIKDPSVRDRITHMGYEIRGTGVQELADYMKLENERWAKVIKEQGLTAK